MAEKDKQRGRIADGEAAEIWARLAASVKPLRHAAPVLPESAKPAAKGKPEPPAAVTPAPPPAEAASGTRKRAALPQPVPVALPATAKPPTGRGSIPGLDRRKTERLREGRLPIDGRIDLHGLTQEAAHRELLRFLAESLQAERRCLLVITGKGDRLQGSGGSGSDPAHPASGILRRAVPHWLTQAPCSARILAVQPAAPQHGGGGALYVLLRRRRD